MGEPTLHSPALLLVAAFSRCEAALGWARNRAVEAWGPLALQSRVFQFDETDYYRATMGAGLQKSFFTFAAPFDPAGLAEVKLQTNRWEREYAAIGDQPQPRPLNLDPGYLTSAKLVLASTKDHSHRVYLSRGIYAEVTLYYSSRRWQARQWTYADYRREDYQQFFSECRDWLRRQQWEVSAT